MSFSVEGVGFDDPTDFDAKAFQDLDEHLRCPICKEFFDTTMILNSCSHSFCALCIRRSLSAEQICPKCRKPASDSHLIHNYDLDTVVDTWRKSRSFLLHADKTVNAPIVDTINTVAEESLSTNITSKSLPVIDDTDDSDDFEPLTAITKRSVSANNVIGTRRSTRLGSQQQQNYNDFPVIPVGEKTLYIETSQEDKPPNNKHQNIPVAYENNGNNASKPIQLDSNHHSRHHFSLAGHSQYFSPQANINQESEPLKSTSLVECPVCCQKMKYIVLNTHVDRCMTGDSSIPEDPAPVASSIRSVAIAGPSKMSIPKALKSSKPIDLGRKPSKVVYAMQSDKEIKKILKDLNLPDHGDRTQRIWRHKEYIALYNANYDSQNPVSASVLVSKLAALEQSHRNSHTQTKRKTPDSEIHMQLYKSQYNSLIQEAKKRKEEKKAKESSSQNSNNTNDK